MGQFFNFNILSHLLKGAGKVGTIAAKKVIDELTEPNIDDASLKESMQSISTKLINNNPSGFILGDGVSKDETEDGHIMVVGGVGSGKSSCIAIPTLLFWSKRVFAIDIKGELYAKTKHSLRRGLSKVFNPLDPNTIGYDPFYLLKNATNQVQEAQAIALALIPLPPNISEPFWIQGAQSLFVGAILHFFSKGYSFIETITAILDTKTSELIEEIYTSETENVGRFVSGFLDMKDTTLSSIFSVLSNHIIIFATDKNVINGLTKKINISPDMLEYYDIYICIPEYLIKQWRNLLTLIVSQFLTHFEKRPDMQSRPILFLLDEFARLGKIEGIVDGLATLRSKKITIAIVLQSLAQLDLHYGRESRQVIADTCQYKAVLNVTDVESQEYFSKAVGTYDKIRIIKSQQYAPITKIKSGSSTTTMTEEKPLIKPHEFATLEQIVLLTPYGAFKAGKKPYYELPPGRLKPKRIEVKRGSLENHQ